MPVPITLKSPLPAKDLPLEVMHAGNELLDHFGLSWNPGFD